ncbi:aspartic proteinase nepenthesin-1 [Amaranthus tricolor]|uniref:aspartic proteinase nepenthesin-1 n=1 Tax=Amaranthus tricolor TaxID=29722 RepID=UPI00258B8E46|nr:aspartic proteinase nepenthesin-1 [Amaranthus tricolor]
MALDSMHSSLKFTILSLALLHFLYKPTCSTSRRVLDQVNRTQMGFRVALKHVDHGSNYTMLERIQRGINRSKFRVQKLNAMVLVSDKSTYDVESKVHPGNGEFLMNVAIGTPPNPFSAIMDTGSDLIWTQCKPCDDCFDQSTPIFDPSKSSTFSKLSCSNDLCEALPTSTCQDDGCQYLYTYGDYSSTQGILATETFTFGSDSKSQKVSVPNMGFGCGVDNEGNGFNQGAGLIGLGRGPLSLVSQLDEPKFSYCLTSIDGSKTSTLLMGSLANPKALSSNSKATTIMTTPLIHNPSQPSFYYLNLQGISVGSTHLPIKKSTFSLSDDGTGGMIIDSGTTITYLESSAFDQVKKAFTSQMNLPLDDSGSGGLDLCFKMPKDTTSLEVPKFVFHFKEADLDLPSENYMIGDTNMGVLCLAMGKSSGMSIFGNVQQQNMMVVHDLANESLSFVPTQCDEL